MNAQGKITMQVTVRQDTSPGLFNALAALSHRARSERLKALALEGILVESNVAILTRSARGPLADSSETETAAQAVSDTFKWEDSAS